MDSEDEAKAAIAALDGHSIHGSRMTVEVWKFHFFLCSCIFTVASKVIFVVLLVIRRL